MKHVHFIGIGGVGMSALAIIAQQKGMKVTGSDVEDIYFIGDMLKDNHINWKPFSVENLKDKPDIVVVGAAWDEKNVEVQEAKKQHLTIKTYSEFLGEIMQDYKGVAVAGIHGKTTTTAMIAFLLASAKMSPSFLIGCRVAPNLGSNARLGEGEYFITEADEYKKSSSDFTSKFLDLKPEIAVVTSIEMDHPDIFETVEDVYRAFYRFACKVPRSGLVIGCVDCDKVKKLSLSLADRRFESYGFSYGADWRIIEYQVEPGEQSFSIKRDKQIYGPFKLTIPGEHNILNATAAIIVCLKIGVKPATLQRYLPEFSGVERRFQVLGEREGVVVVDDYAHHPTSIRATLQGARSFYPNRKICCVFQPHTYSRTKELLDEFAKSFDGADLVLITDIYASAREKSGRIHARHLVEETKKYNSHVYYVSKLDEAVDFLKENLERGDVLVVMGAGDIYKVGMDYLNLPVSADLKD